jgi:hypothetical protein
MRGSPFGSVIFSIEERAVTSKGLQMRIRARMSMSADRRRHVRQQPARLLNRRAAQVR